MNLRSLEEEDLELLKKWRNLDFVRKTTREYKLLNMSNQKEWFEKIHKSFPPRELMFGITNKKNKLIGVTGLTYIDWKNRSSEISIYFAKKNWQETKEAKNTIQLILQYGFNELNIHRLWVEIYDIAQENIELFSRMKFKKEGTLRDKVWRQGRWWNSQIYSILKTEYSNE